MASLRYYRAAWQRGIFGTLREVLGALRDNRLVEMRIVDALLEDIHKKTVEAMQVIGTERYYKVVTSAEPNLYPLKEMLRERAANQAEKMRSYRFLVKQFDNPAISIGRRGQDLVRELSMDTLEEGFLKGNPTVFTEEKLVQKIMKKGTLYKDEAEARAALKSVRHDVVKNIPLFHEDGRAKFMLQVKTGGVYQGKYRAWDAEKYADLVAITTAGEADGAANMEQAREIGTRLVKWNSTGKGVSFYRSIGDDRCANVDGQTASLEPEGTTINGVFYPWIHSKERLPGVFTTCHPYCRHRLSPLPEEALDDVATDPSKRPERKPSDHPIQRAEDQARDLGVKDVQYGHSRNLDIADKLNQALVELKDSGRPVPGRVVIDHTAFQNLKDASGRRIPPRDVPAFYRRPYGDDKLPSIFVNPRAEIWDNPEAYMKQMRAMNEWSSDSVMHTVHHEIGHFLHNTALGNDRYAKFRSQPLTEKQAALITAEVSNYATYNPLEFVAEAYAAMRAGRSFSDILMKLYAEFGGVL